MENKNNQFKNIVQLFFVLIVFNVIAQRYPGSFSPANKNLLYNLTELFRDVPFYFCLHLATILIITSIGVIISRKKDIDHSVLADKIMWTTLCAIIIIHSIGVIFEI